MTDVKPFHIQAHPVVFEHANALKKPMTFAEKLLWKELRGRKLNTLKFRRQHPIHKYILDFYCHEYMLAIEVDGDIHNLEHVKENDQERTEVLTNFGVRVIRFTNDEVIMTMEHVLNKIISFTNNK